MRTYQPSTRYTTDSNSFVGEFADDSNSEVELVDGAEGSQQIGSHVLSSLLDTSDTQLPAKASFALASKKTDHDPSPFLRQLRSQTLSRVNSSIPSSLKGAYAFVTPPPEPDDDDDEG